jgi:hypothetical protein
MYSAERINEKEVHESGIDIDWYFFDKTGKIAVVASGGGMLPDSASMDMDRLRKMTNYFRSLPVLSEDIIIEESVIEKIENYKEDQKIAYLKDLHFMVSRGFYYFDKMALNDYSDFKYHLKAKPTTALLIDRFDKGVKSILPDTLIEQDLEEMMCFFVNELI